MQWQRTVRAIAFCAAILLLATLVNSRSVVWGNVITSNISNADNGSAVGVNFGGTWANSFTTNNQAYLLDAVSIKVFFSNPGGNFVLSIYDDGTFDPGASIATLIGPTSPGAGTHTYSPGSPVLLDANSTYWVVAEDTVNAGNYFWTTTGDLSETGPGTIGDYASRSMDHGQTWSSSTFQSAVLFQVDGTPIPEPNGCLLLLLGMGIVWRGSLILRRREWGRTL